MEYRGRGLCHRYYLSATRTARVVAAGVHHSRVAYAREPLSFLQLFLSLSTRTLDFILEVIINPRKKYLSEDWGVGPLLIHTGKERKILLQYLKI